jgi:Yip1-like protein
MNLVERVKGILLTPKEEWPVIDSETGDANYLFTNYVAILAAIPAVAAFIGYSIAGIGVGRALIFGIFVYVLNCATWYITALVIDGLAPTFGARKNLASALKLSAYAATASWLAGIFQAIPPLSVLSIVGLYSIYLLWLGVPVLMKAPPDRVNTYTAAIVAVVIGIMILAVIVIGLVLSPF